MERQSILLVIFILLTVGGQAASYSGGCGPVEVGRM